MKKVFIFFSLLWLASPIQVKAQDEHIVIWENQDAPTPNGMDSSATYMRGEFLERNTRAELFVYKAKSPNGKAVVVCPGGGYTTLAIGYEGHEFAQWLASHGTTAAVLYYRMPNGHPEVPEEDAAEALRIMRKNAGEWGFSKDSVGISGFSAGGYLAATMGTQKKERPDFMMLFYPVITTLKKESVPYTLQNLLGEGAPKEQIASYSLETRVDKHTPPTILMLSDDDSMVSPLNSIRFYAALKEHDIPASIHIFPTGEHGWGFREWFKYKDEWRGLALRWLDQL